MGALLMLLKGLGILLLVLLVVLLFLLALPAWIYLRWENGKLTVRAKVLFLSLPLYPVKEKKPKSSTKSEKKAGEKKSDTEKEKFQLAASEIFDLVGDAQGVFKKLLTALRAEQLELRFPVHGQDAAATALLYGRVNAFFYSGLAVLQNTVRLKIKDIEIIPDFGDQHGEDVFFACRVGMAPVVLLVCAYQVYTRLQKAGIL